jgi:hypothetical protein
VLAVLLVIGIVWLLGIAAAMILCVAARRIDEGRVPVQADRRRRLLRPVA